MGFWAHCDIVDFLLIFFIFFLGRGEFPRIDPKARTPQARSDASTSARRDVAGC